MQKSQRKALKTIVGVVGGGTSRNERPTCLQWYDTGKDTAGDAVAHINGSLSREVFHCAGSGWG